MEAAKVESKIYQALKNDEKLLSKLGNGGDSIFHNQAPPLEEMKYPAIVYSLLSYRPFFWADDKIWTREAKIRIHILTQNAEDAAFESEIERIMTEELRAIRYDRESYKENKEQIVILDYRMRIDSELIEKPVNDTIPAGISSECNCHCSTTDTTKMNLMTKSEVDELFAKWESEEL